MTFAAITEKLHGFIDTGDRAKVMALCTLIENDLNSSQVFYNDDLVDMLEKRSDDAFSGKTRTYPITQFKENIQKHRKKNGLWIDSQY